MMEENNDIFLAGGDALVYLAKPLHKKYSTTFVWGHPFSTYVSYDQFFNPPPPAHTCTHFGWPTSIPLVAYVLNGWSISQPKNIRISYSLKYKHSKKNSLRKNKW